MNQILRGDMPQKHEITSALKHLAAISQKIGNDSGIDWDSDERRIDISDPYLRFYLRRQIRPVAQSPSRPSLLVSFQAGAGKTLVVQRIFREMVGSKPKGRT
jgi:hypothetical protein